LQGCNPEKRFITEGSVEDSVREQQMSHHQHTI